MFARMLSEMEQTAARQAAEEKTQAQLRARLAQLQEDLIDAVERAGVRTREACMGQISKLSQEANRLTRVLAAVVRRLELAQREHNRLLSTVRRLRAEADSGASKLRHEEQQLAQTTQRLDETRELRRGLEERVVALTAELARVRRQFAEAQQDNTEAIASAKEHLVKLRESIEHEDRLAGELDAQAIQLTNDIAAEKDYVASTTSRVAEARVTKQSVTTATLEIRKLVQGLQDAHDRLFRQCVREEERVHDTTTLYAVGPSPQLFPLL